MNIYDFHTACAAGDIETLSQYHDMGVVDKLYNELQENRLLKMKRFFVANGLFWSVIMGEFEAAKYLIENGMIDPNEMICDQIHILHVLATIGGKIHTFIDETVDGNVEINESPYDSFILFSEYTTESERYHAHDYWYIPDYIDELVIRYNEKKLIEFTTWLLDNYDINISVRTKKNLLAIDSHASIWYNYYKDDIFTYCSINNLHYNITEFTPFHYACIFGTKSMVKLLVDRGCDILCMDCNVIRNNCQYSVIKLFSISEGGEYVNLLRYFFECCSAVYCLDYIQKTEKYMDITNLINKGYIFQHYLIYKYLKEDLLYIILNEYTDYSPLSLQAYAVEEIVDGIKELTLKDDINMLPRRLVKNIDFFFNIKYNESVIYPRIGYSDICEKDIYKLVHSNFSFNEIIKHCIDCMVDNTEFGSKKCEMASILKERLYKLKTSKLQKMMNNLFMFHIECLKIIKDIHA